MIYIVLAIGIIAVIIISRKVKNLKLSNLILVTGAVKSGKSTYALYLAYKEYKKAYRQWKLKTAIRKAFGKKPEEEPLLYSNIPLAVNYSPITKDILERRKRINYKSVVFLDEATLIADNMIYQEKDISERIMLFNKLFGHETHGGKLIYDTQATGDLPAVTRRCISQRIYVHSMIKWIPFVLIPSIREERYSEDGSTIQTDQNDIDNQGYKKCIIPKKIWKLFDCYCFSALTDDLEADNKVINGKKLRNLKTKNLVSYNQYKELKGNDRKENKENSRVNSLDITSNSTNNFDVFANKNIRKQDD